MADLVTRADVNRLAAGCGLAMSLVVLALTGDQHLQRIKAQQELATIPGLAQVARRIGDWEHQMTLDDSLKLVSVVNYDKLTAPEWAEWLVTMGDVYARNLGEPESVTYPRHLRLATCYYQMALHEQQPVRRHNAARLRMAALHQATGQWTAAADWFATVDMSLLAYEAQASAYLDWGTCLRRAGDPGGAARKLDQVINEGTWEQRQQAQVTKLQLLVSHLVDPPPETTWQPRISVAQQLLEQCQQDTTLADPARRTVELAACRLALHRKDFPALVKQVGDLQVSGTNSRVKLEALEILCEGVLRENRKEYAATVISACTARFRGNARAGAIVSRLLRLELDRLSPTAMLEAVQQTIRLYPDPTLAEKVLLDLVASGSPFLQQLERETETNGLARRAVELGKTVASHGSREWLPARQLGWYVQALAAAAADNWLRVEYCLDRVLTEVPPAAPEAAAAPWLAEAVLLDLEAALRLPRDPAAQALRARRFLARYPQHARSQEVLYHLGQAYHDMGLSEQSLEVAKQSFLKTVWDLGNQAQKTVVDRPQWMATIGSVLRGYASAGEPDKADRLFKLYSDYLLTQPDAARVLAAAAQVAVGMGQPHEAIRRYGLAIARSAAPAERVRLAVSRVQLAMQLGLPDATADCRAVIAEIAASNQMGSHERQYLLRQAQDALLRRALELPRESMRAELAGIHVGAGDEPWFSAWLLRMMGQDLADDDLTNWHRAYRQIIDSGLPGAADEGISIGFLNRQAQLVKDLITIRERITKLQQEGTPP